MAEHAHDAHDEHGHDDHGPRHYIKIYIALLVLLVISVAGPFLEIQVITLMTAFGIAVVKAFLVAKYFMHLDVQPKYVLYFLVTALVFMGLFFFGTAPDVLNHEGQNWENVDARNEVSRQLSAQAHLAAFACDEEHPHVEVQAMQGMPNRFHTHGCDEDAYWECDDGTCAQLEGSADVFIAQVAFEGTCGPCHGEGGAGDGPAAAALDPSPANFTDPAFWAQERVTHEHIVSVITDGGAANGRSALMAAFGEQFTEEQVEELATYVESLNPNAAQ